MAEGPPEIVTERAEEESIVLRFGRPVLAISSGRARLELDDPDSLTWKQRLTQSADKLTPTIASIGRVEVKNHPSGFPYMGTGWVIDENVIVTNRHVAQSFAERNNDGFAFLLGFDRRTPIGVDIDFLEEVGRTAALEFPIRRVLYIASDAEPDVAFLQLESVAGSAPPRPLVMLDEAIPPQTMVAIIGYPAKDSRILDQALMNRIFGGVYGRKRLAPGFASQGSIDRITHDCTTLGGNSGSPVLDLATGQVCGLHFSGMFLQTNYAVPAKLISDLLRRLHQGALVVAPGAADAQERGAGTAWSTTDDLTLDRSEVKLTVPLEITVRLGQPDSTTATRTVSITTKTPLAPSSSDVREAVAEAKRRLGDRLDVLSVEAGWRFKDGWITDQRAVIVYVRAKKTTRELENLGITLLPSSVLGVPVDVRSAPLRIRREGLETLEGAAGWSSAYQTDPKVPLKEIEERMKVTVSMSPDAGWPLLQTFLKGTTKSLAVGMYDFTAPHIIEAVRDAAKEGQNLSLVLQHGQDIGKGTKAEDLSEEDTVADLEKDLKKRLEFAWASVRFKGALFKSAYHIKVAVRDSEAFWLSSGNWQSSNQPVNDPIDGRDTSPPLLSTHNRDWHAVVEDPALAKVFEHYLRRDQKMALVHAPATEARIEEEPMVWVSEDYFQSSEAELEAPARYTRPLTVDRRVRVQPLLTPDNYAPQVVGFIKSAKQYVYFQNQSLKIAADGVNPPHYEELLDALLAKQRAGLDVRVIIRRIGDLTDTVSRIKDFGFDMDKVRLQTNCHTKGIVIDGKAVMLGSQNWTGDGTGPNRDASLIFYDQEIAEYFEQAFIFDWGRIGRPKIDESLAPPELATGDEAIPPPGMILMPLSRWLGES